MSVRHLLGARVVIGCAAAAVAVDVPDSVSVSLSDLYAPFPTVTWIQSDSMLQFVLLRARILLPDTLHGIPSPCLHLSTTTLH